ncbi:Flp family type IVb pilin [Brevundimonas sp. CEF1]|uniref:Flp family type IVb pilin n=1 Tax=Brevundimonas sp. CEF1 TaxID=3442642 RepID=UPI003F50F280
MLGGFTKRSFNKDEDGATSIEYSLIAALMAIAVIVVLVALGPSLKAGFVKVGGDMSSPKNITEG